jgi:methionyl aminopeptidase
MRINTPSEIAALRESGRILATVLHEISTSARAGDTPKALARRAATMLKTYGAEPPFLGIGKPGFPDVMCISVNDQVQHAVPTDRALQNGDIVNFDFGVRVRGMITDAGVSVCIGGKASADDQRLLDGTSRALTLALEAVADGVHVGTISAIIQAELERNRLAIVRELVGHGVGRALHEEPEIPNYGRANTGPILKAGMSVAIEPIATLGQPAIYVEDDHWTLRSRDGSRAAQFEHTVLVTKQGCEVLTQL